MKDNTTAPVHPLVELSRLPDPRQARSPEAVAAVVEAATALRTQLPPGKWPYLFQMVPIAYAALAGDTCLVADEMGLGKTPIALCRIAAGGYKRPVVVCTASTLHVWHDTVRAWLPKMPVTVLDEHAPKRQAPAGLVLTTWDLLKYRHAAAMVERRPDLLVVDEAHLGRNPETARHQAVTAVRAASERVLLLTGTPVVNEAVDLWVLLHLLDPDAWPEMLRPAFEEITGEDITRDDLRGRRARLLARVRQFMVRRLKTEVDTPIPDKVYRDIVVDLPAGARSEYDRIDTAFGIWLDRHLTAQAQAAAAALGRVPTADDLAEIEARVESAVKREYFVKLGHLRRLVGPAKVPYAVRWIDRMAHAREPVVVFFEHLAVLEALQEGLGRLRVPFAAITGATPKAERAAINKRFQSHQLPVVLASAAAKEGVTFTAARHLLRVERLWNPAAEGQGDDRIHRLSQRRDVSIWRLIARNTIDDRMDEINRRKRHIIASTVGGHV